MECTSGEKPREAKQNKVNHNLNEVLQRKQEEETEGSSLAGLVRKAPLRGIAFRPRLGERQRGQVKLGRAFQTKKRHVQRPWG